MTINLYIDNMQIKNFAPLCEHAQFSTLLIGSDHRGFQLKNKIKLWCSMNVPNIFIQDTGCDSMDVVSHYPDIVKAWSEAWKNPQLSNPIGGILVCDSGVGMTIASNRFSWIRCSWACDPGLLMCARQHNDINCWSLGASWCHEGTWQACLKTFLFTSFEGGRHIHRVEGLKFLGDLCNKKDDFFDNGCLG
jgi:ribose 5-phosphate isomerase B